MGIKTAVTTSDGRKYHVLIEESERIKHERVTVLSKSAPMTKCCPVCGELKRDITLTKRVYECSCGYSEDRDIHAARNMILLSKKNTCGTQEINAFGENVRQQERAARIVLQSRRIRKFPLL